MNRVNQVERRFFCIPPKWHTGLGEGPSGRQGLGLKFREELIALVGKMGIKMKDKVMLASLSYFLIEYNGINVVPDDLLTALKHPRYQEFRNIIVAHCRANDSTSNEALVKIIMARLLSPKKLDFPLLDRLVKQAERNVPALAKEIAAAIKHLTLPRFQYEVAARAADRLFPSAYNDKKEASKRIEFLLEVGQQLFNPKEGNLTALSVFIGGAAMELYDGGNEYCRGHLRSIRLAAAKSYFPGDTEQVQEQRAEFIAAAIRWEETYYLMMASQQKVDDWLGIFTYRERQQIEAD